MGVPFAPDLSATEPRELYNQSPKEQCCEQRWRLGQSVKGGRQSGLIPAPCLMQPQNTPYAMYLQGCKTAHRAHPKRS